MCMCNFFSFLLAAPAACGSAGSQGDSGTWGRDLPCLTAKKKKTQRQVPNQGRELTWTLHAKGGLLVRIKACPYGAKLRAGWGLPVWCNPRAGLRLHGSLDDADGEELGLSWENNFSVCTREHGLFPRWPSLSCFTLFSFSSVFPVICLLFLFSCGDLWFNKITTII